MQARVSKPAKRAIGALGLYLALGLQDEVAKVMFDLKQNQRDQHGEYRRAHVDPFSKRVYYSLAPNAREKNVFMRARRSVSAAARRCAR